MELDLQLPGAPVAAAAARSLVVGLADRVPPDLIDDARLLVSEVVTNAVLHGGARSGADVGLRVTSKPDCIRFEVCDEGRGFSPEPPTIKEDQIGGWGLFLVDRIAARWGVSKADGCLVWFELDRPDSAVA